MQPPLDTASADKTKKKKKRVKLPAVKPNKSSFKNAAGIRGRGGEDKKTREMA